MNIIEVNNLSVYYKVRNHELRAVEDCSFSLKKGDILGIIGESGCGKSTCIMAILKLLPNNGFIKSGSVLYEGKNLVKTDDEEMRGIRWTHISLIFQASMNSLNPVLTIADQMMDVYLQKMSSNSNEARIKAAGILSKVGLDIDRLDHYPHQFSGGMKQRVMIGMALMCDPKLVIADEPTTALDVVLRGEILELLSELNQTMQLSMIVISHDLSAIGAICNSIAVMYAGRICEKAPSEAFFTHPAHPYSIALMESFPSIEKDNLGQSIEGAPPDLLSQIKGCRFHERCFKAMRICRQEEPSTARIGDDHYVSCHLFG